MEATLRVVDVMKAEVMTECYMVSTYAEPVIRFVCHWHPNRPPPTVPPSQPFITTREKPQKR